MAETRQLWRSSSNWRNWRTRCPQLPMAHLVYHYRNERWSCTTTSSLLPQLLPLDSPCHPAGQTRSTAISSIAPPPWHHVGLFGSPWHITQSMVKSLLTLSLLPPFSPVSLHHTISAFSTPFPFTSIVPDFF